MRKLIVIIKNLLIGLFTTGKHLSRRAVTLQYPDERWEMPERSRGIVVLLSDKETGKLNCTTCLLCQRACPSAAIKIDFEKGEKGKRFLKDFVIDFSICCFCGLCEDSCNFAAIKMTGKYEYSTLDKNDFIWHTDKLQETGLDVPYEKPVKKKKVIAKKPTAKPETAVDTKPTETTTTKPTETTEEPKAETTPTDTPTENADEKKAETPPTANDENKKESSEETDKPSGEK